MNETYDTEKIAPPCYRGETDKCHLCPFEEECNPMENDDVLLPGKATRCAPSIMAGNPARPPKGTPSRRISRHDAGESGWDIIYRLRDDGRKLPPSSLRAEQSA